MKNKKNHKKELTPKLKDQIGDTIPHAKKRNDKIKYRHKNHWLEDEDDYVLPSYRDEEE